MNDRAAAKLQTWIVVLLAWMIVLLMFGIGYMVYSNNEAPPAPAMSQSELAGACSGLISSAIAAQPKAEPVVCDTIETYNGYGGITFDYPIDWEAFAHSNEAAVTTVIRLSEDPLWLCEGCDGPGNALNISLKQNTESKSLDTVVAERYSESSGYSNVVKSTTAFGGKTALTVKAQFDGMHSGEVEEIIYVTPATIVVVSNDNFENDAEVETAWKILQASLNFSAVR